MMEKMVYTWFENMKYMCFTWFDNGFEVVQFIH